MDVILGSMHVSIGVDSTLSGGYMMRVKSLAVLNMCFILAGCGAVKEQICIDRLNKHFAAFQSVEKADSLASAKRMFSQLTSLTGTVDLDGCSSRVRFAIQEMYTASVEAEAALSDENVLAAAVMGIFDAEKYSPMMQKLEQSEARFESACKVLRQEGVDC